MPPTKRIARHWDPQLSEHEIHLIGTIFVQWASMEHEIFVQTLSTFESEITNADQLPKAMNNLQFTGVLELWHERVVKRGSGRRKQVLQRQHDEILRLKDARDALAHGMWHWSTSNLGQISTIRVRKKEVITSHFTVHALGRFASKIATINFRIRFPGGLADLARARMKEGGYISRRAMTMFTGVNSDSDGYPVGQPPKRVRAARKTDA